MALLLALPLARGLADHYQRVENQHTSGRALLTLSRYAAAENRGEHIYISLLQELPHLRGMPYVPHAAFLLGDVHHEFLPASQIVGRLFEHRSPAFLLLSDGDAAIVSTEAPIERVAVAANREAQARGFALYRLPTDAELKRPEHVIRHADLPDGLTPSAIIGEGVRLLGCRAASGQPGARASLTCYWQATAPLPKATYIGFAHLFDAQGTTLIAQDDHVLGQESYPLNAWQSEDIVMEEYVFELPGGMAPGDYPIHVGIYTWPDLARLTVPGSTNNAIQIRSLTVEPSQ
jgi:hypothetical protein